MEAKGVEPSTSALRTHSLTVPSETVKGLTSSGKLGCTTGCTSEPKTVKAGANDARAAEPMKMLAAQALKLSKSDRQRLLVMLAASLGADDV